MPLAEELHFADPSQDPHASTRWNYHDPADPPLPEDDPRKPFCARHAATIARLRRSSFGPHIRPATGLPPGFRDWHFGSLGEVLERRVWCRACALVAEVVELENRAGWDEQDVIACWVWDGLAEKEGDGKPTGATTMRLRIASDIDGLPASFRAFDLVPLETWFGANKREEGRLFSGRLVAPDHFDLSLVRSWIRCCTEWHGTECIDRRPWKTSECGASFLRLISLSEEKIIECVLPPEYAALSYVWGKTPVFRTLERNVMDLMQVGSLTRQDLPKSIRDAMALARAIGFEYIWVDSICIIQDSDADKSMQIGMMDDIYRRASLIIVAAAGDHANAGIPGLEYGSRSLSQHTIQVSEAFTLVALRPDFHNTVAESVWNERGWTYQERLLSRRCLFSLPNGSIGFQCAKALWGEDYYAESPSLTRCAPMMDIRLNMSWAQPGGENMRDSPTVRTKHTPYLHEYSRFVEEYSERKMTFASDRLLGIDGVLDVFRREFNLRYFYGLPDTIFHLALLWQPRSKIKRVPTDAKYDLPLFPSWSWAGWIGPVGYENWNDFNGLLELTERARRVIPFGNLETPEGYTLPSLEQNSKTSTSEKQELFAGWSKISTATYGDCFILGSDTERYHSVPFTSVPVCSVTTNKYISCQPVGLIFCTRVASFSLTQTVRSWEAKVINSRAERSGRFGLALPGTMDPWIGTILLPAYYRNRLSEHYEFVILSESYGFNDQEEAYSASVKRQPFEVYDVMMIQRIEGNELLKYHRKFSMLLEPCQCKWWDGKAVVERIGVGRILKSAWETTSSTWECVILV